jgi:hypothetical protein
VKLDGRHLHCPDHDGKFGDTQFVGAAAGGERDVRGLDEVGAPLGNRFW